MFGWLCNKTESDLIILSHDYTTRDIVVQHSFPICYHCRSCNIMVYHSHRSYKGWLCHTTESDLFIYSLMTTQLTTLGYRTVLPSGLIVSSVTPWYVVLIVSTVVVYCSGLLTEPAEMGTESVPPLTSFPTHCGANDTKVILPWCVACFYKKTRYFYIFFYLFLTFKFHFYIYSNCMINRADILYTGNFLHCFIFALSPSDLRANLNLGQLNFI